MAAGGPRTLRMAGRTADGVYLRVGRDPTNLRSAVENLRAGAADAGRHLDEVSIGLVLHTITSQDPKEIAAISRSMAAGFYEYSPALFEIPGIAWPGRPVDELKELVTARLSPRPRPGGRGPGRGLPARARRRGLLTVRNPPGYR